MTTALIAVGPTGVSTAADTGDQRERAIPAPEGCSTLKVRAVLWRKALLGGKL